MQLVLTHNLVPNRKLTPLSKKLVQSVTSQVHGRFRVGMVTSNSSPPAPRAARNGARQLGRGTHPVPPGKPPLDLDSVAIHLGVLDQSTFTDLPRWTRGVRVPDRPDPSVFKSSDLTRIFERDRSAADSRPLLAIREYAPPHPAGHWPLSANILDPVRLSLVCDGPGQVCVCSCVWCVCE